MTSDKILLTQILEELKALRQDINTHHVSIDRHRINPRRGIAVQSGLTGRSSATPSPARPPKQNRSDTNDICWYHRRYNIEAKPNNCPGYPECKFDLQAEIERMKTIIKKHTRSFTPAQNRIPITKAKSSNRNSTHNELFKTPAKPTSSNGSSTDNELFRTPATTNQNTSNPQLPTQNTSNPQLPTIPSYVQTPPTATINWSDEIEQELDQMDVATIEPLEEQLADLSD